MMTDNRVLQLLLSVAICALLGTGFYYAEAPLTKRIIKMLKLD